MCAIFGCFGTYDPQKALASLELLRHRGPDDSHYIAEEKFFLGHHRLAITDQTFLGRQPMQKGGVSISFNGEIYNFKALKKQLSDERFESQSDTEVILAAYKKWGEAFVSHLKGMFAIALLDGDKLILARDLLGKKPLYYVQNGNTTLFASELKALTHYKSSPIEKGFVFDYLRFQTAIAPKTAYENIYAVSAGEMVVIEKGVKRQHNFGDILSKREATSFESAVVEVEKRLLDAIKRRLEGVKDPVFLLSGGLDSSLIAAMATKILGKPVMSYSVGYEEGRYDETGFAEEVATHIGAKHHRIVYTKEAFLEDITTLPNRLDEPLNDPAMLPLMALFRRIKKDKGTKVVFSGEGSDELFLGYRPYLEFLDIELLEKLTKKSWLKNYFKAHSSEHREWYWFNRILNGEVLFQSSAESFQKNHIDAMLQDKRLLKDGFEAIAHYHDRFKASKMGEDATRWYRYIDLKVHQGDYFLKKLDRISMQEGIEARTPFLDQDLVQYVMGIEGSLLLYEQQTKALLKAVAKAYLPQSIIERKKRGFSYPFNEWMQELGLFEQMRSVNSEVRLIKTAAMQKLLDGAKKGAFKQHVFGIYALLMWLKKQ